MKKLLFTTLLSAAVLACGAQTLKSFTVSGGYASSNQSRIIAGNKKAYSPLAGWGIEAGAQIWENGPLLAGIHLGYIKKGFTEDLSNLGLTSIVRLNYLYLAPRITYAYELDAFTPYGFLSPRFDIFTGVSNTYYQGEKLISEDKEGDNKQVDFYKKNHKPLVLGLTAGIGAEKKVFKNISVALELAYWADISKSIDVAASSTYAEQTARQNAFTAWITLKHGFGKKD